MGANLLRAVILSAVILGVAGCVTKPIYNVSNQPVATVKGNPSMDEVRQSIIRAGASLGWQMKDIRPGLIEGVLLLRTHMAQVEVSYDSKAYSITYKDSKELQYDG